MKKIKQIYVFIKKGVRYLYHRMILSFKERRYESRLRYIYEDNSSLEIIIVFSGMATRVPKYMYMRTLKEAKTDKLFILDDFGYKGSYYWYENGTSIPLDLTSELINSILKRKKYKYIYTAGSSKGGTAAIFYGLKIEASDIIASACQYWVGNYLRSYKKILHGMIGNCIEENEEEAIQKLNNIMPQQLKQYNNSSSVVHILFSQKDEMYKEHIVDLIKDLDENQIKYKLVEGNYESHGENGPHIAAYLKNFMSI